MVLVARCWLLADNHLWFVWLCMTRRAGEGKAEMRAPVVNETTY